MISYNPGYQNIMKDLKQSTKQRFGALDFGWPKRDVEIEIVAHESGVSPDIAGRLVIIGERSRNLKGHGLEEGISTRMLIYAGLADRAGRRAGRRRAAWRWCGRSRTIRIFAMRWMPRSRLSSKRTARTQSAQSQSRVARASDFSECTDRHSLEQAAVSACSWHSVAFTWLSVPSWLT